MKILAQSSTLQPRTYGAEHRSGRRDAAYRRLATVILRLDVASLGRELGAKRVGLELPHAA